MTTGGRLASLDVSRGFDMLFGTVVAFFVGGPVRLLPSEWGRALISGATIAVEWLFLCFLYRKNVFLRV